MDKLKKILDKIKGVFGKMFRSGLDEFLVAQFQEALRIGIQLASTQTFSSTHEFAGKLWMELRMRLHKDPGTWLTILAGYVIDAMKKQGMLKF